MQEGSREAGKQVVRENTASQDVLSLPPSSCWYRQQNRSIKAGQRAHQHESLGGEAASSGGQRGIHSSQHRRGQSKHCSGRGQERGKGTHQQ
jgi:hypothetical protein